MADSASLLVYKTYMKALKIAARIIPIPRPTLFSGANSSEQLCEAIGLMNIGKLLIVTDNALVDIGLVGNIEAQLIANGVDFVRFSDVTPDPLIRKLKRDWRFITQSSVTAFSPLVAVPPLIARK